MFVLGVVSYLLVGILLTVIHRRASEFDIKPDDAMFYTFAWPVLALLFIFGGYIKFINRIGKSK